MFSSQQQLLQAASWPLKAQRRGISQQSNSSRRKKERRLQRRQRAAAMGRSQWRARLAARQWQPVEALPSLQVVEPESVHLCRAACLALLLRSVTL